MSKIIVDRGEEGRTIALVADLDSRLIERIFYEASTASSENGWLVLDRNGNGTIDDFSELFGNLTPQPPNKEPDGFLALAVFDEPTNGGNGNGVVDPGDGVYRHLRVWIDANHNGVSEPVELHTLQELGIFRIGLRFHETPFVDQFGNRFATAALYGTKRTTGAMPVTTCSFRSR